MSAEHRTYDLDVSEALFRLAAECVRLLSEETKAFSSLDGVVAARGSRAEAGFPGHATETIIGHLETLTSAGAIRIAIRLDRTTDEQIAAAQDLLETRLGRSISLSDTVSVLLFDMTVEHASVAILQQLIGTPAPDRQSDAVAGRDGGSGEVLPIR